MAKMLVHDEETGDRLGEINIPDYILDAAEQVAAWMQEKKCPSLSLHGLKLVMDE